MILKKHRIGNYDYMGYSLLEFVAYNLFCEYIEKKCIISKDERMVILPLSIFINFDKLNKPWLNKANIYLRKEKVNKIRHGIKNI